MKVSISGKHMDITDALRAHVNEKMEKIIRHFDHVTNAQVVLCVEKDKTPQKQIYILKGPPSTQLEWLMTCILPSIP